MKRILLISIILSLLFSLVTGETGVIRQFSEPLSPRIANYKMEVYLDTEKKLIQGIEILTWKNTTSYPTDQMQFHLYYNAWYNDQTSMFRSFRRGRMSFMDRREDEWAYCRVDSIIILDTGEWKREDITKTIAYIQPDDGNPLDRTVMQIKLPRPIQPGESIALRIKWESKIPRTFARTGVRGDYFFLAQWFPKVGVFEQDGTWNCHQFIQTEFYADFGVYDVRLRVPAGWKIGATGKEIETIDHQDGTVTHRFYQEDVHDFAWVTSPYFHEYYDTFSEEGLPEVRMRLLLMPDHLRFKERYFAATRAALKYYGTWWGPYPYDHITIIDPAFRSGSGGMEYPTFFTGGTRWLSPKASRSPEGVTVHECGHQFWYGMVANNEFEYAWLDEGFNTYSTSKTMETAFSSPVLVRRYLEGFIPVVFSDISIPERYYTSDNFYGFYSSYKRDKISVPSWKYGPGAYRVNSYDKACRMIRTLENILGWDTFQQIMSTYFKRYRFKHPRPEDFFRIVNEITGEDYNWFFEEIYNKANVLDYAVERVTYNSGEPSLGYLETDSGFVLLSSIKEKTESDTLEQDVFSQSSVIVRRWGEMILPVEIRIIFSNQDTVYEQWDGVERWKRFTYPGRNRIVAVDVDPENKLVLDINSTNNSWIKDAPAEKAAYKWSIKWMLWLQNLLEFLIFFI